MDNSKFLSLKEKVIKEATLFLIYFLFLLVFFTTFNIYERLILDNYAIHYTHYGYSIIEALILAKIILIGQSLKLGENFSNRPLFIITLYKTLVFSGFVVVFSIIEHFLIGLLHGDNFAEIYHDFIAIGFRIILAKALMMFFVFIFFFAFLEIGSVLGEKKLFQLFFKSRSQHNF